ncbi:MAG TPA: T9SS type A sorting domain-containing protein [Bacteroidota bacterium]|nr:T9SS type A sorting domain-containing protein [Bacteroidota bacterium]
MKTIGSAGMIIVVMLLCALTASAAVTVTPASGGTGISGTKAQNGTNPALRGFTTIGTITITEGAMGDFGKNQTNVTLILTAPTDWVFNPGQGTVGFTAGRDILSASLAVTATTITVTLSTDNGASGENAIDELTISGIQVQSTNGEITLTENIYRTVANPGTASIAGIVNGTTSFGPLSSDGALPVELVSFIGAAKGHNAELQWKTASEVNNYGFEVELKLANGWSKIGFVPGAGTVNTPRVYTYTDQTSAPGTYAYRLKQVDRDGRSKYSEAIEITVGAVAAEFKLHANFPNPFNPTTTIRFTVATTGQASLDVYSILGQRVAKLFDGTAQAGVMNSVQFDASKLSAGIYISVLKSGGTKLTQEMILAK